MIVIDLETTGLDPDTHGIVEFGAVDMNTKEKFSQKCRISKQDEITQKALDINGHTKEEVRSESRPLQTYVFEQFDEWTCLRDNLTLAGHNLVGLDVPLLRRMCNQTDREWRFGHRFVDLHSVAYATAKRVGYFVSFDKLSPFTSVKVYELVNIPKEPEPHKAVRGAVWEAEAFSRLMKGESLFDQFSSHEIPSYLSE